MTELMTLEEVAAYLRVTKKTIYRLLKQGKIPATKVSHQWRFEKARIDKWLHQNSVGAKASIRGCSHQLSAYYSEREMNSQQEEWWQHVTR